MALKNTPIYLIQAFCCAVALLADAPMTRAQSFSEISQQIGINAFCQDPHLMGGGVALFDYNNDNYPDLFIIGGKGPNTLLRNNWDGSFSDVSQEAGVALRGLFTMGVAVGDIDNDGDEDLLITTGKEDPNVLLQNNGNGSFTDISQTAGIQDLAWSTSASFGDFNLDGWIDIYVNNYAIYEEEPFSQNIRGGYANFLYQNQGNNTFVNVASTLGVADVGCGLAVAFTDYDHDSDPDLYVANDFGLSFEPNELYINKFPDPGFQAAAYLSGLNVKINAMGIAIGDYDEDGDLDYYVTNIADNPLFENREGGQFFQDISSNKGVNNPDGTSWGTAFLDFNNDTYLDLIVANGQVIEAPHQNNENRLFQGNKDHQFEEVSTKTGLATNQRCRGLSLADLDNDGDLDMLFGVVAEDEQSEDHALLYQNNLANKNKWFKLQLVGRWSNRNGYGSQVRVVLGDRSLIREADGGSSYLSHHSNVIHFGLGHHSSVDSLIITWPGGHQDIYTQLKANQAIKVVETSHWYSSSNREISIFEGDSIFLAGAFQKQAGIYHHFLSDDKSVDTALVVTKLTLLEKPIQAAKEVAFTAAPNPFSTHTQLRYHLKQESQVQLSVFDLMGRELRVLIDQQQSAGDYVFPYQLEPTDKASGMLIFKLLIDSQVHILKTIQF